MPIGDATWERQQAGALTLHELTLPGIDAFRPTLAVTRQNLILGLNVSSVKDAAAREQSAAPNFSQSATYKTAAADLAKPNLMLAYVDTRTLFERIYGIVKPAALLGAAFLYPQLNNYADLSKLPPVDVIARHLSPTIMSSTVEKEGELIESIGSVTLFQAGSVLTGSAAGLAVPFLESKFGGLLTTRANGPVVPPGTPFPFAVPPGPPAPSPSAQPGGNH